MGRCDEVRVLGVPLDVARDERAERNDLEALAAGVVEHGCGKAAAEAMACSWTRRWSCA